MKQAIVFDVEDVLVNNRPEFFIATYNVYKNNSGNNLITMIEDVPSDFIEKYSVPDRWANQIKHRLACYHCRDNAITPKTREEFEELKNKEQEKLKKEVSSATYISDIVAGRPVLGHPSQPGGFRLRYGKCRTAGLSSMAMHPLTMEMLKNYIAIGTQLKYEGPGKSSAMSLCDDIEGPII